MAINGKTEANFISLTKGKLTQVSPEDYKYLSSFNWYISSNGYAVRMIRDKIDWRKRKAILMHRVILDRCGIKINGFIADHINRNKLDNRRENLRSVSPHESNLNRKLHKNNKSGHRGVHMDGNKWEASVWVKGRIRLGRFEKKKDAILARIEGERKYYGKD